MRDILASAWLAITRHRLRSLLAVAGVAVGVCALTSIVSVEGSWQRSVTEFFAPMDLETVVVAIPASGDWRERGFSKGSLEPSDVQAIRDQCPEVTAATLVDWQEEFPVGPLGFAEAATMLMSVRAVEADFTRALPEEVREGRLFTAEEAANRAPVCVLTQAARELLFMQERAVGGRMRIGSRTLTVVGVIAGNRHLGLSNQGVFFPATLARTLLGSEWTYERRQAIFVRSRDAGRTVARVEEVMRRRVGGDGSRPFTNSLWQSREAARHARTRVTFYTWLAALCALLVAGIGIAAVLFVSVAERTGEIGTCRALGATRGRIYAEYLTAAGLLALLGAALGALTGIPAAAAGVFVTQWRTVAGALETNPLLTVHGAPAKFPGLSASISWEAVGIGLLLALIVGLAAALAPASEAAAVDPAKAIAQRHVMQSKSREALTILQIALSIVVLAVLTSYFGALDREEAAEARKALGGDSVSVRADPIYALQEPVEEEYEAGCREALEHVLTSPTAMAKVRAETPLLTELCPRIVRQFAVARGSAVLEEMPVTFTTAEAFSERFRLKPEDRGRVAKAFRDGSASAVIGTYVRDQLFGSNRDPAGQSITIGGRNFTVVALAPDPPGSYGTVTVLLPVGQYVDLKHRAIRPESWAGTEGAATFVTARARDLRQFQEAAAQLRDAILSRLPREYRKGMALSAELPANLKQFVFQYEAVAARGAVGSLAVLLVALIGLANMLLVSVHSEMREVGIRRALGATRADIALHFLSRGVLLTTLGAAVGLTFGLLACMAIARYQAGVFASVSVFWDGLGVVATILAGSIISLFPATIASRIHPVDAIAV